MSNWMIVVFTVEELIKETKFWHKNSWIAENPTFASRDGFLHNPENEIYKVLREYLL